MACTIFMSCRTTDFRSPFCSAWPSSDVNFFCLGAHAMDEKGAFGHGLGDAHWKMFLRASADGAQVPFDF